MDLVQLRKIGKRSAKLKWYKTFSQIYTEKSPEDASSWLKNQPVFNKLVEYIDYYPGKTGHALKRIEMFALMFPDVIGKCAVCGADTKWSPSVHNWRETCSLKCGHAHSNEARKATSMERYGTENPSSSPEIQKRRVKTFLKRFGTDNPWKSEKVKQKAKRTMLKRYGVANISQSQVGLSRKRETFLKNFGETHWTKNAEHLAKHCVGWDTQRHKTIRKNCLEKYGVEHHSQREDVKLKVSKTQLERYGANPGTIRNGFIPRLVEDKFGKKHIVLGYEDFVIDYFSKMKNLRSIVSKTKLLPRYRYTGSDGKLHNYHPDMEVIIGEKKYVVEVKSEWTLNMDIDKNVRKFRVASRSCIRKGDKFVVIVYHGGKFLKCFNPKSISDLEAAGLPVRHHQPLSQKRKHTHR